MKVRGLFRWKEEEAFDVVVGDVIRYGGVGTCIKCDDELCEWAWFFGRFVENGYGHGTCYRWNEEYEDLIEWLEGKGVE